MSAFNKFQALAAAMPNGAMNLATDVVKIMLTNTQPNSASQAVYNDIKATEVPNGAGYTTGGAQVQAGQTSTQAGGTYKFIASMANPTWTATGAMGGFRYAVIYDSTTGQLIGWWDYASTLNLVTGQTFAIVLDAVNGVFQVA